MLIERSRDIKTTHYKQKEEMMEKSTGCPCEEQMENVRLARACVPFQQMDQIYSPIVGLCKGTIFPELYWPYKSDRRKV